MGLPRVWVVFSATRQANTFPSTACSSSTPRSTVCVDKGPPQISQETHDTRKKKSIEQLVIIVAKVGNFMLKMEVGMSLNALARLPLSSSRTTYEDVLVRHSLFTSRKHQFQRQQQQQMLVVEAKGKRGMMSRQFQRPPPPPLPKIEDDGNPKFVIFIRMANVYLWYPLSVVTGGTTAKIMVAAKDNFLGKYIYKDTLARNLAAVIYRDEKEIQKTAFKQFRVLRTATEFRYGYKLVENGNIRAGLNTSDVIELPTPDQLKTVLDKVKDFFGDAKDSFGKMTALNSTEESEEKSTGKAK